MKILFISRAYPPILGGIENQNAALAEWLPKHAEVTTIANKRGKKFLPVFLPYATLVSLVLAPRHDVVLLGDGVLGVVGWFLKIIYRKKPVFSIVHGLDMSYPSAFYQTFWVKRFLPSLDGLIAVSCATRDLGVGRGISVGKFSVVPNGIVPVDDLQIFTEKDLEAFLGMPVSGKRILLTVGRLAKRKGVAWFVRNVLPILPENVLCLVAGAGPEEDHIREAIRESGMEKRARLLGKVSDYDRLMLLRTAHLFVQPNIPVPHDIEGFGIALIEATVEGLPVIASRLEGLQEAIADGQNGILVEPENPESFRIAIGKLLSDEPERKRFGNQAKIFTREHYHWEKISAQYIKILSDSIPKSK
ncbi:MAG: glycosyltransferase family 4 protein [Candidatus Moranbacteria bacterium]|nr:glycosyltransferase family 4 protein [Candidatus Moranbacteria bacterium]